MENNQQNNSTPEPQFKHCPQCGRKGLYHVQQQYYRCRYCGINIVSPPDQTTSRDRNSPPDLPDALSKSSV